MLASAEIYSDGSGTRGGPAGIGFVAVIDGPTLPEPSRIEGSLSLTNATNQQAELLAAAYALDQIPPCEVVVLWSDSEYVVHGMNEWIAKWIARGWRTQGGSAVKNRAHWERLIRAAQGHPSVSFKWLKGHAGHPLNERADELAGAARLASIEAVAEAA